jgi:hypothetical protein
MKVDLAALEAKAKVAREKTSYSRAVCLDPDVILAMVDEVTTLRIIAQELGQVLSHHPVPFCPSVRMSEALDRWETLCPSPTP